MMVQRRYTRFVTCVVLITSILVGIATRALADDAKVSAFKEGIRAGIEFEKELIRYQLAAYRKLVDAVFDYRTMLIGGEVPPPLVDEHWLIVKKKDGTVELTRVVEVKPPAYFPIRKIKELRKSLLWSDVEFSPGYLVVVPTRSLTMEDVAFREYLVKSLGYHPVYVPDADVIIVGSWKRKADVHRVVGELQAAGVPCRVVEAKKPVEISIASKDDSLVENLMKVYRAVVAKESKLLNQPVKVAPGYIGALTHLQAARNALVGKDDKLAQQIEKLMKLVRKRIEQQDE